MPQVWSVTIGMPNASKVLFAAQEIVDAFGFVVDSGRTFASL